MKPTFLILVVLIFCSTQTFSNEPLWTDSQRAEKRDAIVVGHVQEIKERKMTIGNQVLSSAMVGVEHIEKPHRLIKGKTIELFFETDLVRCPAPVKLSLGQRSTFYISVRKFPKNGPLLFLDLGSDVRNDVAGDHPGPLPE